MNHSAMLHEYPVDASLGLRWPLRTQAKMKRGISVGTMAIGPSLGELLCLFFQGAPFSNQIRMDEWIYRFIFRVLTHKTLGGAGLMLSSVVAHEKASTATKHPRRIVQNGNFSDLHRSRSTVPHTSRLSPFQASTSCRPLSLDS
ncbi:hypothetical protein BKA70DRAFT_1302975 [Coprinopsis sp. MPI-PUGE-AT-0042]|nr:hypothetical protein BKA70DRAFT_1302975 [Coprinopsis sp. MPI-PUGE-AT-0042]